MLTTMIAPFTGFHVIATENRVALIIGGTVRFGRVWGSVRNVLERF